MRISTLQFRKTYTDTPTTRQAFYRNKATYDASRRISGLPPSPLPSPSFTQTTFARPLTAKPPQTSELQVQVQPSSTLDKVRQHTRRLSQRFGFNDTHVHGPVHTFDHEAAVDKCRTESFGREFESEAKGWTGRDSVTLGGESESDRGGVKT